MPILNEVPVEDKYGVVVNPGDEVAVSTICGHYSRIYKAKFLGVSPFEVSWSKNAHKRFVVRDVTTGRKSYLWMNNIIKVG
jgi:hypothetical protein